MKWTKVQREDLPEEVRQYVSETALEKRIFVTGVGLWPMLTISTHLSPSWPSVNELDGISLSCSYKTNADGWWEAAPIPKDLLEEAMEMLGNVEPG